MRSEIRDIAFHMELFLLSRLLAFEHTLDIPNLAGKRGMVAKKNVKTTHAPEKANALVA